MKKIIKLNEQKFHGLLKNAVTETLKNVRKQYANKEFHNFAGLAKEDTGLSVDIFLDQCNSYQEFNHPFWLYFRNSYGNLNNFIPITIKDKKILIGSKKLKIFHKDITSVIRFIDRYFEDICAIANGELDVYDLYKKIKSLSESTVYDNLDKRTLEVCEAIGPHPIYSKYGQAFLAGVRWADEHPVNKQESEQNNNGMNKRIY